MKADVITFGVEYNVGDCEEPQWKTFVYGLSCSDAHFFLLDCLRAHKPMTAHLFMEIHETEDAVLPAKSHKVIFAIERGQSTDLVIASLQKHLDHVEDFLLDIKDKVREARREKELLDEAYGVNEQEIHEDVLRFTL